MISNNFYVNQIILSSMIIEIGKESEIDRKNANDRNQTGIEPKYPESLRAEMTCSSSLS